MIFHFNDKIIHVDPVERYADYSNMPGADLILITHEHGDQKTVKGIAVKAVLAYNIVHKRDNGMPYHPKGAGNGYVIDFGKTRVYVAGDTENIPKMKELSGINIAFLPMNLPYTMTPKMVADAVRMFNPKILYPYHYGNTNPEEIVRLLKDKNDCEVHVRDLR